jgi:hypothetical protein
VDQNVIKNTDLRLKTADPFFMQQARSAGLACGSASRRKERKMKKTGMTNY